MKSMESDVTDISTVIKQIVAKTCPVIRQQIARMDSQECFSTSEPEEILEGWPTSKAGIW